MAERYRVCTTEELQPGERKIVDAGGRSIGVFNVGGSYHALLNLCPHQRGPLCLGQVTGTMLPSEVGRVSLRPRGPHHPLPLARVGV